MAELVIILQSHFKKLRILEHRGENLFKSGTFKKI